MTWISLIFGLDSTIYFLDFVSDAFSHFKCQVFHNYVQKHYRVKEPFRELWSSVVLCGLLFHFETWTPSLLSLNFGNRKLRHDFLHFSSWFWYWQVRIDRCWHAEWGMMFEWFLLKIAKGSNERICRNTNKKLSENVFFWFEG